MEYYKIIIYLCNNNQNVYNINIYLFKGNTIAYKWYKLNKITLRSQK